MEKLSLRLETAQDMENRARILALEPLELILGAESLDLERRLAAWVGAAHCVAVSDAACGIALALRAAGIGKDDHVMCAALGCALPVQGIMLAGALPLFADINPNTYTLDPFCLEYALGKLERRQQPLPRALIVTDLFGAPAMMQMLEKICAERDIVLIEDMSGAFGAKYQGRRAGNFGRFSVASFASPGSLDEPGGGAVFCRGRQDSEKVESLRNCGRQQSIGAEDRAPCVGSSDAALVRARLDTLTEEHAGRRKAAERYRERLEGKIRVQQIIEGGESVYSQLVIALPEGLSRPEIVRGLYKMNIPTGPPLCGLQSASTDWNRTMLVNTYALAGRLLSLPIHSHLSCQTVDYICESLLSEVNRLVPLIV